jgi:AAA15 family ATPase/GTPase
MIESFEIKNFGPIPEITTDNLGKINLIIGDNGAGKTILLKSLYTGIKTIEDYKRGKEKRNESEILADKLFWTFEVDKLGDLVRKCKGKAELSFQFTIDQKLFRYQFGRETTNSISLKNITNYTEGRSSNSIFLPPKEVLSLQNIILQSREVDKVFGFDNTYFDLARSLLLSPRQGNNYQEFSPSRKSLRQLLGGKIEYDTLTKTWLFKKGNQRFPIGLTAEGIKKISILDTLLVNRYLDPNSIIFIDELESALHPTAISQFLDIIMKLAGCGMQFFIASHSYFVIKKLFLIAQEQSLSIPILSQENGIWIQEDLQEGLPDNAIISESIRLYREEVRITLE